MNIHIVPDPKKLEFKGRWFEFDGFENFPEFLSKEFQIPKGSWKIKKVEKSGTGINIKDKEVEIWGDTNICFATLIQLIMQKKNQLPEIYVEEDFKFKFRGYHLDIARGGVPLLKEFKRILRLLYLLKYNFFAIYFEDLFPWKSFPQIGALRGRLTEEELIEIIDYGKNLGIEVFPSLELCGHMENILTLPEFMKYSEWHRPEEGCLDVSNEEARNFTYKLLSEVIEFFPSQYIHIGGDETWALGRGRSLDKTGIFQGPELFEMHHKNLIYQVKESGKIPMVWGDMLTGMYLREEEKERWKVVLESPIWDETVIANWDYTHLSEDHFEKKINMFGKRKEKEIASPGVSNWGRFYPNFDIALTNITNFLRQAKKENLPGFLLTAWGDDGAECLYSYLNPLILATIEIAEGKENWEEKYKALFKEKDELIEIRKLLGQNSIAETIKHVFLGDTLYRYNTEFKPELKNTGDFWADYYLAISSLLSNKEELLKIYSNVLNKMESIALPEDLSIMKDMLKIAINRLNRNLSFSEYIAFGKKYADLWLSERKKANLEKVIIKIYGAGGRADLNTY
jgi:hexosaminidase